MNKSIKTAIDEPGDKDHAKVFVAGSHGCCRGRTGYVLGANYRPRDSDEVEDFSDALKMFASVEEVVD